MYPTTRTCLPCALASIVAAAGLLLPAQVSAAAADPAPANRQQPLLRAQGRTPPSPQKPAPAPRPAPQPRRSGEQQQDKEVRELKLGSAGELSLSNVAGDITIMAGKGDTARLEVVKTAHAPSEEEARQLLEQVHVEISVRGTRVDVSAAHPQRGRGNRRGGVTIDYSVAVPPGTRVRVQSVAGSISSTGVKGESSYESVSGSIRVSGAGRVVAAKSISGEVEVTDTDMDTAFQSSTASGSIVLRRVSARRLDLGSISGAIVLDGVQAQAVTAQTVSGDLRFDATIRDDGRYQLRSHSGSIRIGIPAGSGFELDANSFSGSITTDMPVNATSGGGVRGRALRGVHGKGGAVFELTTFSGSITIGKR